MHNSSKIHRSCQEATLMPRIDDALERLASLPPVVPLERWRCGACDTALMTHAAFSVHMAEQHNVTPAAPSAHVLVIINECADHTGKVYAWTIGDVEAEQYLKLRRDKDSLWDADMIDTLPGYAGFYVTDGTRSPAPLLSALAALGLVSDGGK